MGGSDVNTNVPFPPTENDHEDTPDNTVIDDSQPLLREGIRAEDPAAVVKHARLPLSKWAPAGLLLVCAGLLFGVFFSSRSSRPSDKDALQLVTRTVSIPHPVARHVVEPVVHRVPRSLLPEGELLIQSATWLGVWDELGNEIPFHSTVDETTYDFSYHHTNVHYPGSDDMAALHGFNTFLPLLGDSGHIMSHLMPPSASAHPHGYHLAAEQVLLSCMYTIINNASYHAADHTWTAKYNLTYAKIPSPQLPAAAPNLLHSQEYLGQARRVCLEHPDTGALRAELPPLSEDAAVLVEGM